MKIKLTILAMMTIVMFSCNAKKEKSLTASKEGFIKVTGGKVWYKIVGADKKGIPLLVSQLPASTRDTIAKYEESGDFASPVYQEAMTLFYNKHLCRLEPWPQCLTATMEKLSTEIYGYMIGPSEFTLNGTLRNTDLTDDLYKIKCPVLFTCGEFDEATPWTTAYYQSKIRGSEIYVFKDASHSHHLEKQDEYMKVVGDFLRKKEIEISPSRQGL